MTATPCRQCGQEVPSTARNFAFVLCANCIPPEFHPSRHRLTESEWQADLARAKGVQAKDVDRLITRTPRKRSRWGRPWERKR